MGIVSYISASAVPIIILLIIIYGVIEKIKVYDTFLEGAKEGLEILIKIFPTLIGIFLAVGALRASGILDLLINLIKPVLNILKIPAEIMPLALLRPISGSASMAVATDIMSKYGVDSIIGIIASTIMGSTETTFYTIALYTSAVGIKKIRFVLIAALVADVMRNAYICSNMSNNVVKKLLTYSYKSSKIITYLIKRFKNSFFIFFLSEKLY